MRMTRGFGLAMLSLLFIGGVAIAGSFVLRGEAKIPNELKGIALSKPVPLDRRTFMSTNGEAVFPVPSRRKWTFLVVGYAHCPDICPFILENLADYLDRVRQGRCAREDRPDVSRPIVKRDVVRNIAKPD